MEHSSVRNAKDKNVLNGDDTVKDSHDGSEDEVENEGNIANKTIEKKSQPVTTADVMRGHKLKQPSNEESTASVPEKVPDSDEKELAEKLRELDLEPEAGAESVSYKDLFKDIRDLHSEQEFNDADYKLFCELLDENFNVKSLIIKHLRSNKAINPYELNLGDICLPGTIVEVTNGNKNKCFEDATLKTTGVYAWEIKLTKAELQSICKAWNHYIRLTGERVGLNDYLLKQLYHGLNEYSYLNEFSFLYIGQTENTVGGRLSDEMNATFGGKPSTSQKTLTYFLHIWFGCFGYPTRVGLISRNGSPDMEGLVGKVLNAQAAKQFDNKGNVINREQLGPR
ncbi:unnamed protein product [Rotaria socialis]|uniref:Uncharacterized protein n=1 Tax=Rotaria socialis TaxID=392032 RepID=A0A820VC36_9BILA|nr:unnamed protein product [Rotaria socialis]CAF4499027.1 unnamed protein product [Rotaria socialis]